MTIRGRRLLLAFVILGVSLVSSALASPPEARLHVVSSLGKLSSAQPDGDFLAQYETTAVIHAAWGEHEALQVIVEAPSEGLENLRVVPGAFSHPSGDVWESNALSARFVGFVTTEEPYYGTLHVGLWADPLLRKDSISIPGGQWRAVWIEVAVPLDAEAGRYTGEIDFEAEGWSAALPLEIVVWAFDLPKTPSLASSFMLYPRYIYERYGLEKGSLAADAVVERFHECMLAHRIMPTLVVQDVVSARPELRIDEKGELKRADFTAFDERVRWALDRGQSVFGIEGPKEIAPRSITWYRTVGDHLRDRGWIDRFYTWLADETYDGVAESTTMVREVAPDLKNLITRLPAEGYPGVDWWCPRLGDAMMHAAEIDDWLDARGWGRDQIWVYTAGNAGSDVPALHLDVPGIEARMTPLAVWFEGFGGLLFWCVDYWPVDPWEDPMVYPRQNGNGALFYPDKSGYVESIRLKQLRDGFDDVDYAALLTSRLGDDVLAKRILKALPLRSALDWERDPHALEAWRLAAGYYLSGDRDLAAGWVDEVESRYAGEASRGKAITDLGEPDKGWHGGRDQEMVVLPDGVHALHFTLDDDKTKIWRLPSPRDWQGYREIFLEIKQIAGDPVRLNFKLGSGLIRRQTWNWELHMAPGELRQVRIPIAHERVNTESLTELALFLWDPESPRRFELRGIWIK